MMSMSWAFDADHAKRINQSRQEFLSLLLKDLSSQLTISTVLDVGCGVGIFSDYLHRLGFEVRGVDAKEANVVEARRRFPKIRFDILDVEDAHFKNLGEFDLVLCFGLLYHLENPFQAIRNLSAVTKGILISETVAAPHNLPIAAMVEEYPGQDQSLNNIALVPSEAAFIKMLCRAGVIVYKPRRLPDHGDYRESFTRRRLRTALVGSKQWLFSSELQLAPEPPHVDHWHKGPGSFGILKRLKKIARWTLDKLYSGMPVPIPVRLPWGGVWLAWKDAVGRHVRKKDGFEQGELQFVSRFLGDGMTVLDIGAHQGLYTILSARKIGANGRVIAFEPSPRELRRLRIHLQLNRCRNVKVEPTALGSNEGTAELFVCLGEDTGCNSLRPPAVFDPTQKIRVPVTTLDAYLGKIKMKRIDFIKLDVEGAELDVLKGANVLLKKFKPLILCEVSDIRTKPWGYQGIEILNYLRSFGYRCFVATQEGRLKLQPTPNLAAWGENLILVHEAKLLSVEALVDEPHSAMERSPRLVK